MSHETMMLLLTPVSYVHCPLHTAPLWTTFYYDASQGYESEKLNVLKIQMGFCFMFGSHSVSSKLFRDS